LKVNNNSSPGKRDRKGGEGKRKGEGREREEKRGDGEDGMGLPPLPSLSEILNTPLGAVVNDR